MELQRNLNFRCRAANAIPVAAATVNLRKRARAESFFGDEDGYGDGTES